MEPAGFLLFASNWTQPLTKIFRVVHSVFYLIFLLLQPIGWPGWIHGCAATPSSYEAPVLMQDDALYIYSYPTTMVKTCFHNLQLILERWTYFLYPIVSLWYPNTSHEIPSILDQGRTLRGTALHSSEFPVPWSDGVSNMKNGDSDGLMGQILAFI